MRTDKELSEVSTFFVENFFLRPAGYGDVGGGDLDAWERVRAQLTRDQQADWLPRFGKGSQEKAVLLVARELTGQIVGCVSIGVSVWSKFGSNGARFDPRARESEVSSSTTRRDKTSEVPVLANLVVSPQARRRGIGAKLVARAEAVARPWGFNEVALAVESNNAPAIDLYRQLGYSDTWVDVKASKLSASLGGVRTAKTTNVVMTKPNRKGGGLFAR